MDERIKIETKEMKDGSYRSRVFVKGEFYAEARSRSQELALGEANYYAMQIEFDEWGNW